LSPPGSRPPFGNKPTEVAVVRITGPARRSSRVLTIAPDMEGGLLVKQCFTGTCPTRYHWSCHASHENEDPC